MEFAGVELRPPSEAEREAIASRWPFALLREGERWQLPFEDPVGAMPGLYLPQVPLERRDAALEVAERGRVALARGLARIASAPDPLAGLLLACPVLREQDGAFVPGLAYFPVPDAGAPPATGSARDLEAELEPGAGGLLDRALDALSAARRGLPPVRSVKVVGAPYMGERFLDFLLCGQVLVCLQRAPSARDPVWVALRKEKVRSVVHLPLEAGVSPGLLRELDDESGAGAAAAPLDSSPEDESDEVVPPASSSKDARGQAAPPRPRLVPPAQPQRVAPERESGRLDPVSDPDRRLGLSERGARRVLRFLWHLAACDGEVHETERVVIEDYRRRLEVDEADAAVLEREGRAGEHLTVGKRAVERVVLLDGLLDVAAADGRLDRAEEKRLVAYGTLAGVSRGEIRRAVEERFAHQSAPPPAGGIAGRESVDVVAIDNSQEGQLEGPSLRGVRRIYRVLWNLAACDGEIARGEVQLLEAFRVRHGISRSEARSLEREGRAGRGLIVSRAQAERSMLASELIELAAVDGVISPAERRRILKLGALLRMDRAELDRRIRERLPNQPAINETGVVALGDLPPRAEASGEDASAQDDVSEEDSPPSARGESGAIVILGLPDDALLAVDLLQVQLEGEEIGVGGVLPGVHRVGLTFRDEEVEAWLRLGPREVQVLALEGTTLASASANEVTRLAPKFAAGQLDEVLATLPPHLPWQRLTEPLRAGAFPPQVLAPSSTHKNRRLEETWFETHSGEGGELLAELAYAFLLGLFGDEAALSRWTSLVQGIYHCGEELPQRDPALFASIVDLLIAQQRLLPRDQLANNTPAGSGAHYLSEDLGDTDSPLLIEAARRWATFCGGYHPGAPPPGQLPAALLEPTRTALAKTHEGALRRALEALAEEEARSGARAASLIPLLAHVGQLQELSQDLFAAIQTQERLLEVGAAQELPSDLLRRGLQRLARLCREVGQGQKADAIEVRALAHVGAEADSEG